MDKLFEIFEAKTGKTQTESFQSDKKFIIISADSLDNTLLSELIEKSDSSKYDENALNRLRLDEFKKTYTEPLLKLIYEQDFEYGLASSADYFFIELYKKNESVAKEWLNIIFNEHFNDPKVLIGILQIVMHMDYYEIFPQGQSMALSVLNHQNPEVKECGIRSFENWGTLESLNILKNIKCNEDWLDDYLNQVIHDLEEIHYKDAAVR